VCTIHTYFVVLVYVFWLCVEGKVVSFVCRLSRGEQGFISVKEQDESKAL